MAKKNFVLVSLEDSEAKKIANVVGNDSCRKILDYLAEHEATESELSKKLDIPISTVHYNLKQLMETGLVAADEFHYSEKGREVMHYKLANKYIIITPKKQKGIISKLKGLLPGLATALAATGLIYYWKSREFVDVAAKSLQADEAMPMLAEAARSTPPPEPLVAIQAEPNLALWFLAGAVVALAAVAIYLILRKE